LIAPLSDHQALREDQDITAGPPHQRRDSAICLLSQISLKYLVELREYERIVKQRNQVLQAIVQGRSGQEAQLEVWDCATAGQAPQLSARCASKWWLT